MKKATTLSFMVASMLIMASPTYAVPSSILKGAVKATSAAEVATDAARATSGAKKATDAARAAEAAAVKGIPNADDTATLRVPGGNDTPNEILRDAATEQGLSRENAVLGTPPPVEPENNPVSSIPVTTRTGAGLDSDPGSGTALSIAVLAGTGYGIYRVRKSRR